MLLRAASCLTTFFLIPAKICMCALLSKVIEPQVVGDSVHEEPHLTKLLGFQIFARLLLNVHEQNCDKLLTAHPM